MAGLLARIGGMVSSSWLRLIITHVLFGALIEIVLYADVTGLMILVCHVAVTCVAGSGLNWAAIASLCLLLLEVHIIAPILNLLINETLGLKRPIGLTRCLLLRLLRRVITARANVQIVGLRDCSQVVRLTRTRVLLRRAAKLSGVVEAEPGGCRLRCDGPSRMDHRLVFRWSDAVRGDGRYATWTVTIQLGWRILSYHSLVF